MSEFVKQDSKFFVGRHNTTTGKHEVMQYNSYNGNYNAREDLHLGETFDTAEKAQQLVDMLTMIAQFNGATYEYYVLQEDSNVTVVESTT